MEVTPLYVLVSMTAKKNEVDALTPSSHSPLFTLQGCSRYRLFASNGPSLP